MRNHFANALFRGVLRGIDGQHGGDAAMALYLEHEGTGGGPAKADGHSAHKPLDGVILDVFQYELLQIFPFHAPGMLTGWEERGKGLHRYGRSGVLFSCGVSVLFVLEGLATEDAKGTRPLFLRE